LEALETGLFLLKVFYSTILDEVVPILQERGVFHKDYEGKTLREHLSVPYQYGLDARLK